MYGYARADVRAVDYGTVNTVAVLRRPDGQVRPLLGDGSPLLPSAACVGSDGRLLVGRDAENAGRVDPVALVPDPRSRIDAGTVALGRSILPVVDVIGGTLARVVQEAIQAAGGVLPRLVLTHPGSWDETRRATLTEAGFRAGLGVPTLVPTPVAAAWYHSESIGGVGPGRCLLVYHLGAGTFESAAEPLLARTVDLAAGLLAATGTPAAQVGDVLLLGGSSRIPLVTTLLRRRLSPSPTACKQPELAVAEGALTAAGRMVGAPLGSAGSATAAGDPPTLDLPRQVAQPAETSSMAGPRLSRRPTRLLAVAAGLAFAVVVAGLFVARQPQHAAPGGGPAPTCPRPTATGQAIGVLASVPVTRASTAPVSGRSPSTKTSSTVPAPASATPTPPAATSPVAVSVTAAPTSGTCSTDVKFVAYFTVHDAGKYRWHWVFGGPDNYSSTSGDHDRDKTGDEHITKKFNAGASGTYWGQVQITSPVTIGSNQASVQITCSR